jgi:hypothetical protein
MSSKRRPRHWGEFIEAAEANGWSWRVTGTGHLRVFRPGSTAAVTVPATPSDHRALRNARADARRVGLL